jgi:hypothetical protein
LKIFEEFTQKAVIILPTDDLYKTRLALSAKEDNQEIPITLINDMKSKFLFLNMNKSTSKILFNSF